MSTKIFVNLAVKDLPRSKAFYTALGYTVNEQFTNEMAASIVISDDIYVMLLTEPFFKTFTTKELADATKTVEVMNCLSADSREAVDELVRKAVTAGGTAPRVPQDHGYMYGHSFDDPDGHIWEVVYMNMEAVAAGAMEQAAG